MISLVLSCMYNLHVSSNGYFTIGRPRF